MRFKQLWARLALLDQSINQLIVGWSKPAISTQRQELHTITIYQPEPDHYDEDRVQSDQLNRINSIKPIIELIESTQPSTGKITHSWRRSRIRGGIRPNPGYHSPDHFSDYHSHNVVWRRRRAGQSITNDSCQASQLAGLECMDLLHQERSDDAWGLEWHWSWYWWSRWGQSSGVQSSTNLWLWD